MDTNESFTKIDFREYIVQCNGYFANLPEEEKNLFNSIKLSRHAFKNLPDRLNDVESFQELGSQE